MTSTSLDALLLLAHAHAMRGSREKARILLTALYALAPDNVSVCRLYAWVLLEEGRYAEALPVTNVLQQLDTDENAATQAHRLQNWALWGEHHS